MKPKPVTPIVICFLPRLAAGRSFVQATQKRQDSMDNAAICLGRKTASLGKYTSSTGYTQQRALKRLQRKEQKMLREPVAKDQSLYYQDILEQDISYNPIASLSNDMAYRNKLALENNDTIDSLKGVQRFIEKQESARGAAGNVAGEAGICPGVMKRYQVNSEMERRLAYWLQCLVAAGSGAAKDILDAMVWVRKVS